MKFKKLMILLIVIVIGVVFQQLAICQIQNIENVILKSNYTFKLIYRDSFNSELELQSNKLEFKNNVIQVYKNEKKVIRIIPLSSVIEISERNPSKFKNITVLLSALVGYGVSMHISLISEMNILVLERFVNKSDLLVFVRTMFLNIFHSKYDS